MRSSWTAPVISLTEQGFDTLDKAMPFWQQAQTAIANEINADDMAGLRATLNDVTAATTG